MKRKYESPLAEIEKFSIADVITTSQETGGVSEATAKISALRTNSPVSP